MLDSLRLTYWCVDPHSSTQLYNLLSREVYRKWYSYFRNFILFYQAHRTPLVFKEFSWQVAHIFSDTFSKVASSQIQWSDDGLLFFFFGKVYRNWTLSIPFKMRLSKSMTIRRKQSLWVMMPIDPQMFSRMNSSLYHSLLSSIDSIANSKRFK